MGNIIDLQQYQLVIKKCQVEGDRCWGCNQENCQSCSCMCHKPAPGWGIFKGEKCLKDGFDREWLEFIIKEVHQGKRDKDLNWISDT